MNLLTLVLRRLAAAAGVVLAASVLLFVGSQVLPGDAASASLGVSADADEVAKVRAELGLDRRPVAEVMAAPLADTALLVAITAAVTLVVAAALGTAAGLRPGSRLDRILSGSAVAVVSVPQFVTASLLVLLLATTLHVLPAVSLVPFGGTPLDRPEILVLPVLSLALFAAAWASQIVRAAVLDADAAPYVEAARLAGVPERRVLWRHLLPATVPPCAQMFGWLIGALFGGTTVVERVFGYPGLSQTLVDSVRHHDTPVLEGVGLVLAAILVACLLVADVFGELADPRSRTA